RTRTRCQGVAPHRSPCPTAADSRAMTPRTPIRRDRRTPRDPGPGPDRHRNRPWKDLLPYDGFLFRTLTGRVSNRPGDAVVETTPTEIERTKGRPTAGPPRVTAPARHRRPHGRRRIDRAGPPTSTTTSLAAIPSLPWPRSPAT